MKHTILVVEDNAINRMTLCEILREDFNVVETEGGAEALAVLENCADDISAVLLDIIMPQTDGYEVLRRMGKSEELRQIPVVVLTGSDDEEAESKALSLGAVDFLTKPYKAQLICRRLMNLINLRQSAALVRAARTDRLTGLYTRDFFLEKAKELVAAGEAGHYVLTCMDVDNFKLINDQYGSAKGDFVLSFIADTIKRELLKVEGIACRVESDSFAILYPCYIMYEHAPDEIRKKLEQLDGSIPPITISVGRYVVSDKNLEISAMYDRALLAKRTVKGRFDEHVAFYDESMRENLLHEQEIIGSMDEALEQGQFEIWFQPQYNHSTGARIGAEALVRWRHPEKGIISPDNFVPIFERNGFIYELDKYIWEQACVLLRKWIDQNREPLPVSVNISRFDIFRDDLIETITGLTEKYRIPVELLRLEITESAFAGSTEHIVNVVKSLIRYGFVVEIDDFGSAYSSLNTLKDVPAQILKLDMRFLEGDDNSGRGGNVLESIVRMARWLGMSVIAEGVETRKQADYLESIGCSYVQGYLYARPMTCAEYEVLAKDAAKEEKMIRLETVEALDNSAFWDPDSLDTLIFNSLVGGACIFEYADGHAELLRANKKYSRVVGGGEITLEQALAIDLNTKLEPESITEARKACQRAIDTGDESVCEIILCDVSEKRKRVWLRLTMRVIAHTGNHYLFYCINEDLSEQRLAEENEHMIYLQLQAITHNMQGAVTVTAFEGEKARFIFTNDQFYSLLGYTRQEYEKEIKDVFDVIHPEDREAITQKVMNANRTGEGYTAIYRVMRRDGGIMWVSSKISIMAMPGVEGLVQLAVANDITAERQAEAERNRMNEQMQKIMDNVGSGITAAVGGRENIRFLFANDRYYEMFGYTRERYTREVDDSFTLIHEDDRQRVIEAMEKVNRTGESESIEYRAIKLDGNEFWIKAVISIASFAGVDEPVQVSIFTDITEEKLRERRVQESSEQLRFLNVSAHELLAQADVQNAIDATLTRILEYFDGNRAYIVENDYVRQVAVNTYEVCAEGVESEKENLKAIPFVLARSWFDAFERDRFISIPDVDSLGDERAEEREILRQQSIHSLVAVPLHRGEKLVGFVGVDDPRIQLHHVSNLQAIGDYITAMLTRRDLDAKIKADSDTLRRMMDDTPGGFVRLRVGDDGSIATEYVNETFCRIRGMTREQILKQDGESAFGTVHPDDKQIVRDSILEMINTGRTNSTKYRLLRADGQYIPVSVFGRISTDENGRRYINVYYADLSEEERRDLAVRETVPFVLSAIMSSTSDIAFAKDKNFKYLCGSAALAKIAGLSSADDVIGKTDYDLFPKEAADQFRKDDEERLKADKPVIDYVESITGEGGKQHYVRISKYILHDTYGSIIGLYGSGRDITEERDAYARLKLLTNSIPGGIATYIYSGGNIRVSYYNDTFCKMLGYTREEYDVISSGSAVSMVFKEDLPVIMTCLNELLADGKSIDCRYRVHKKEGGYLWVNLRGELSERHGDIAVINTVLYDISEIIAAERSLKVSNEWFRLAAQLGGREIARYDIADSVYHHDDKLLLSMGFSHDVENVPQVFIDRGLIAPECIGDYVEFFEKIRRGEERCILDNALITPDKSYRWVHIEATVISDAEGRPYQAMLITEDITEQREQAAALQRLRQSLQSRPEDSYTFVRWNLTREILVPDVEGTLIKLDTARGKMFNDYAKEYADKCVFKEDVAGFCGVVNSDALLREFRSGKRTAELEYREKIPGEGTAWRRLGIELVEYPNSKDIEVYLTFEDIDIQKRSELHTIKLAQTDPLTGILNRAAFEDGVKKLTKENPEARHALFLLDIDGFKNINDTNGHAAGDRALIRVAETLRHTLRGKDLVGRLGGDEFVACLEEVADINALKNKARQICDKIRDTGKNEPAMSVSIGIALYPDDGRNFDELYKKADVALYRVKESGKNNFAFFSDKS